MKHTIIINGCDATLAAVGEEELQLQIENHNAEQEAYIDLSEAGVKNLIDKLNTWLSEKK